MEEFLTLQQAFTRAVTKNNIGLNFQRAATRRDTSTNNVLESGELKEIVLKKNSLNTSEEGNKIMGKYSIKNAKTSFYGPINFRQY